MRRPAALLAMISAFSAIAFAIGYEVGERHEAIKKTDPEAWRSSRYSRQPIAQDAIRRWSSKVNEVPSRAMENRLIGWMAFPDRTCVSLNLTPGSIGGVPVYCYTVDRSAMVPRQTTKLVGEYSDVE